MSQPPEDRLSDLAAQLARDARELIEAVNASSQQLRGGGAAEPGQAIAEAERVLRDARAEADRLIQAALRAADESEKLLADAHAEADRLLAEARQAAENARGEITRELQAKVAAVRQALAMASAGLDRLLEVAVDPRRS